MDNTFYKVYITKLFTAKDKDVLLLFFEISWFKWIFDFFLFKIFKETGRKVIRELQEAQERHLYEKSIPILQKASELCKAGKTNEAVEYILNNLKWIKEER